MLVLGAYRSDEIPRAHQLRRLRHDLRRNRLLRELALEPLTAQGHRGAGREGARRARPSPRLAGTLHDRTGRHPVLRRGACRRARTRRAAAAGTDGPRPRARRRRAAAADDPRRGPPAGRRPLRAGPRDGRGGVRGRYPLRPRARRRARLRGRPRGAAGLWPDRGARAADAPPSATRSPATPIYEDVPWLRRRSLHRELAAALEARGSGQAEVAGHWLAARDGSRALESLVRAVEELAAVHAYRDAARLARQALEMWPQGERGAERIALLERYARFAELAGELAEAARAQREVVTARRSEGAGRALADAERRLARSTSCRATANARSPRGVVAADAFAANGLPGEAAAERLIAAGYLRAPASTARRSRSPAAPARRPGSRSASTCGRGPSGSRRRAREGRGVRRGDGDDQSRALARARARAHARGGRGLPAARHGPRDRRRLRRRARRARHRDRLLRGERRRRHGAHVPELHGLRAARAGRLGARGRALGASCASRAPARTRRWWRTACSARSAPSAARRRPPGRCSSGASRRPRASTWSR